MSAANDTAAREVAEALEHADWWTGHHPFQGEMTTTATMRILAAEIRRLRLLVGENDD